MRYIVFVLIFFSTLWFCSAELEFFLGEWIPYSQSQITSSSNGWDMLIVWYNHRAEPFPKEYIAVDTDVREILKSIITYTVEESMTETEILQYEQQIYETLIGIESPQFIEYITIAIQESTDIILEEKIQNNILLTPFEETFLNCDIPLSERQAIVLDILERIGNWEIESLDMIQYSDPSFWDCIIPFPDVSRQDQIIENSFDSNQENVRIRQSIVTEYEVAESIQTAIEIDRSVQNYYEIKRDFYTQLYRDKAITPQVYDYFNSQIISTDQVLRTLRDIMIQEVLWEDEYQYFENIHEEYRDIFEYMRTQFELGNISLKDFLFINTKLHTYLKKISEIIEEYNSGLIEPEEYHRKMKLLKNYYEESFYDVLGISVVNEDLSQEDNSHFMLYILIFLFGIWFSVFFIIKNPFDFLHLWKK